MGSDDLMEIILYNQWLQEDINGGRKLKAGTPTLRRSFSYRFHSFYELSVC